MPPYSYEASQYTFGLTFVALWCTFTIKMSILLFYRRLARHHFNTKFILALNIVGVIIVLQFIASLVSNLLTCRPVNAFWMAADPGWDEIHHPVCINRAAYIMSFGAINLILDLVLTIIPIAMIHKIQLPRLQKIALWFLFAIGVIPSVAAILRMYSSYITFVSPAGIQDQACRSKPSPAADSSHTNHRSQTTPTAPSFGPVSNTPSP